MKKVAALCLSVALLCLFGCASTPEKHPDDDHPYWIEKFSPPGTTPEGETVPWPNAYPISEIDPILGPGPFSLNELEERFGEPVEIYGYPETDEIVTLIWYSADNDWFTLIPDTDQLWNDVDPEIDRSLPMEVYQTLVVESDFPLPRGIALGDSIEKVRVAYPGAPYWGNIYNDGSAELFYLYDGAGPGEYGIWYYFENNRLRCATIKIKWRDLNAQP